MLRRNQNKDQNKIYDAEGRELIDISHLLNKLAEFNKAYQDYLDALSAEPEEVDLNNLTLKDFLIPNHKKAQPFLNTFQNETNALFTILTNLAQQAVEFQQGGFLGIGADQAAYDAIKASLQTIGQQIRQQIIGIPSDVVIDKNLYCLTALSDSPEAFLQAQTDQEANDYITSLSVKETYQQTKINADKSNLIEANETYLEYIDSVQLSIPSSTYLQNIQSMEAERSQRWKITNWFYDLFGEKEKLDQLKGRYQVALLVESDIQKLSQNKDPLVVRSKFSQYAQKLLHDTANISEKEMAELRSSITALVAKDKKDIQQFCSALQKACTNNIDKLDAQLLTVVAKQFAFLAESAVKDIESLNTVRLAVIAALEKKLKGFQDPQMALTYIENLKAAKPDGLDEKGELKKLIANLEIDYSAWKNVNFNSPKLIAGNIPDYAIATLRADFLQIEQSSLPQITKVAEDFVGTLKATVLASIATLASEDEAKIIAKQFAFLAESAVKDIESLNTVRLAVITALEKKLKGFQDPQVALTYIGHLKAALPEKLDQEGKLTTLIANLEIDYLAWKNIQDNGAKLVDGGIEDKAIALLRTDVVRAGQSTLPQVQQAASNFVAVFKTKILTNVETLASVTDAAVLAKQFAFLAESAVKDIESLSTVRLAVIAALEKKLKGFQDPQVALTYIEYLKAAKPDGLDEKDELKKLIANLEIDYLAWKNVNFNSPKLIAGNIPDYAIATLRADFLRIEQSSLPQITKVAENFVGTLKATVLANIAALASEDEAKIIAKQFAFLAESAVKDIESLNTVRLAVITALEKKLKGFQDPQVALTYIGHLKAALPDKLDQEGKLTTLIADLEADYLAWKNIQENGAKLVDGSIEDKAITLLRADVVRAGQSALPQVQQAAVNLVALLKAQIEININRLKNNDSSSDRLIDIFKQHFQFLATAGMHAEEELFVEAKKSISQAIERSLENFENPNEALTYIERWKQIGEAIFRLFDIRLYQSILNKANQYKSMQLLQSGWFNLLNDKKTSEVKNEEVEQFIAAVLWLDKPTALLNNPLIELLKTVGKKEVDVFKKLTKEKLKELHESVINDLKQLSESALSEEKRVALRHRLRFVTQANAMYTSELGELRKAVISTIVNHISIERNIKDSKRYFDELYFLLPKDLQTDEVLAQTIKAKKDSLVEKHFTDKQRKLHEEYKTELEFLRTGKLSLWQEIEKKLNGNDPRALTRENIEHWRHHFIETYTNSLTLDSEMAVGLAADRAEEQVYREYLQQMIAADTKEIGKVAEVNLVELADLGRKRALIRLNKILARFDKSLEDSALDSQVDVNMLLFQYSMITGYQDKYADHPVLGQGGLAFIRKFQEMAQHEGGFTTAFVAQLSLEGLRALDQSWVENPTVQFKQEDNGILTLKNDVVGEVDTKRATRIQLLRYVLLHMVLELIAADVSALLRGEKIDTKLLNDRIAFALPKLEKEVEEEARINKDSGPLRKVLLTALANLNPVNIKQRYESLVIAQMPEGFVRQKGPFGILDNFSDCETNLLGKIKLQLRDQMDILSKLNPADLLYQEQEESIQQIDYMISQLQERLARMPKSSIPPLEAPKKVSQVYAARMAAYGYPIEEEPIQQEPVVTEEEKIRESIASFEKQKENLAAEIAQKKRLMVWYKHFEGVASAAYDLINNENLSLKDFIMKLDSSFYELLDENLAGVCMAMRDDLIMARLLQEKEFTSYLENLKIELKTPSKKILDIVRDLPENIIKELEPRSADMVRQLQYRFADRFKKLMVKSLDKNLLDKDKELSERLDKQEKEKQNNQPVKIEPVVVEAEAKKASSNWGFSSLAKSFSQSFYGASAPRKPQALPVKKTTAEDRLRAVLNDIDSDVVKELLSQLAATANAEKISLQHIYDMKKISAPIAIPQQSKPGYAGPMVFNHKKTVQEESDNEEGDDEVVGFNFSVTHH